MAMMVDARPSLRQQKQLNVEFRITSPADSLIEPESGLVCSGWFVGNYHAGAMLGAQISSPRMKMTPWLGLQLEGLHYTQTGVIEQD
jgi:hypothetical protein